MILIVCGWAVQCRQCSRGHLLALDAWCKRLLARQQQQQQAQQEQQEQGRKSLVVQGL
jgi:hypothetical protein